ncbi:unnamed protein product [Brassica rapa]|uniref:Uncharacterized protein n=1 Tax=Brassica campestris TaxID=3711 RepID=A0A3P5Z8Y4_BRACM|nr:unnamed protein product [Brassica rapa]VDC76322.1 unnamed protein product [Brassica rapa]
MITDNLIASSCALDDFLIKKMLEQKSLETETDFCDYFLHPDLLSSETNITWHFLRSILDNCVALNLDDIVVYNTFFEKHLESLIVDFQSELKLVCSDVEQDMHDLNMNTIVAYLDKNLVCNVYFDVHLERLKCVLLVLGKEILIFELSKYLSCTYNPGLLVFVLRIQERQVQPLRNKSIDRAQRPEIWRSFVVQTGYLGDACDRGSVETAISTFRSFTEEGVMNFPNWRFSSPSIREYKTSKGDSGPRKKRPEPKVILHAPKHCKDHGLIVSAHHEKVLNPRISKRKHIFTWLKNILLKPFHELFYLSYALKEIRCRKMHEPKLLRPKNQFDFVRDENFSDLALSLSFPNRFRAWPNFKIDKPIFGDQFTCLMLAHVLDDYPKGLDPDFDVLRIEKPFDYFFRRFDHRLVWFIDTSQGGVLVYQLDQTEVFMPVLLPV